MGDIFQSNHCRGSVESQSDRTASAILPARWPKSTPFVRWAPSLPTPDDAVGQVRRQGLDGGGVEPVRADGAHTDALSQAADGAPPPAARRWVSRITMLLLAGLTAIGAAILGTELVRAQDTGDRVQGQTLARTVCAVCHAVERIPGVSPNPASPPFRNIADTPGMSALALRAALQTPHRAMPNLMLEPAELADIVAYILSLKSGA
jgi:mono/diheme cytochrome c family protein